MRDPPGAIEPIVQSSATVYVEQDFVMVQYVGRALLTYGVFTILQGLTESFIC